MNVFPRLYLPFSPEEFARTQEEQYHVLLRAIGENPDELTHEQAWTLLYEKHPVLANLVDDLKNKAQVLYNLVWQKGKREEKVDAEQACWDALEKLKEAIVNYWESKESK